ncbi:hypothetical protein M9Y10_004702 [Tritrichomonas musculus]|uniref:Uncharacterized protein n=1 Tax=Tritrichomonas musculus TaxID=1915356 RepID=A0ABR2JJB6_9EUKA
MNRTFTTPSKEYQKQHNKNKLSSLYDDSDENNDNNNNNEAEVVEDESLEQYRNLLTSKEEPVSGTEFDVQEYLKSLGKVTRVGKRAEKTFENSENTMNDLYIFKNKEGVDLSKYREALFDIIINGNYRIKFSPKCATRDGAELYCKKKFDKSGYPLYRLIPTRSDTTDPFNNPICDLNGDKVEDIVIVDRLGRPVIINGFKLVKSDPYKKIWQTERIKNKGKIEPFEIWMRKLTNSAKTWTYTNDEWNNGKFKLDVENYDKDMQNAVKAYEEVGLSKPRISSKLTARGLWASIFSKIWQIALFNMFKDTEHVAFSRLEPLKTLFSYFKVCNALFVLMFEIKAMAKNNCESDWKKWLQFKRDNSKKVNADLGIAIQTFYNEHMKSTIPIDKDYIEPGTEIRDEELNTMIDNTHAIVFTHGLSFSDENFEAFANLADDIRNNKLTKEFIKELRESFCDSIDTFINNQVGGNYIITKKLYKIKKDEFANQTYITKRTKKV